MPAAIGDAVPAGQYRRLQLLQLRGDRRDGIGRLNYGDDRHHRDHSYRGRGARLLSDDTITMRPDVSVLIPAHNEGPRLAATIDSLAAARTTKARLEIIIADDQSSDETADYLRAAWPELSRHERLDVHLSGLEERSGIPRTRNYAATLASADILFITDAHVRISAGWDELVYQHIRPDRILAGVVTEANTPFVGYGCRLVVPFMGTYWNKKAVERPTEVQVAACPATALTRELFNRIGGYDDGMIMYGAAEPEFSIRAWLSGAEIILLPGLRVEHRFKPPDERIAFIRGMREHMVANGLRFGLLYSDELGAMQLLRYYSLKFPNLFEKAVAKVADSDVWTRRSQLQETLTRPFSWFVDHFGLTDSLGGSLP
ncbi:MAG: glycosyltransferase [Streptosporangiaceae bacterium]